MPASPPVNPASPLPDLTGQVALVTGGAHRLGGAISLGLADAGADVVVHTHASPAEAQATVAAIEARGRRAWAVQADLADTAQTQTVVPQALSRAGRLDILVHAASPFEAAPFANVTEAVWDRALSVTLKSAFFLAQAAAPALTASHGAIVFITDVAARRPFPSYIPHSAAKAGLENLVISLAQALAPAVRVNGIAPGVVLPPPGWTAEQSARAAARTLVGRVGTPDDIVKTVLFLLASPFITGQILTVDGGRRG